MVQETTTIKTDLSLLKEKIIAFVEMINTKDDWDSIDEIKRNLLESKEVSILILSILEALLTASKNKESFIDGLAQICDDAIKLNGFLELFDKPVFKMGIGVAYDSIYNNPKVITISDELLIKITKILTILKEQL